MPPEIDDATSELLTEVLRRCCGVVRCSDSALWLAENDHLFPTIGFGPHSEAFIGNYTHPLDEGIISMVFASGQAFCENNIQANPQHSAKLDQQLSIRTDAMIVVPIVAAGKLVGVITSVHTSSTEGNSTPSKDFSSQDMAELEFTAALVGRVVETAI